jgi:phenylacetate-CoA ligase
MNLFESFLILKGYNLGVAGKKLKYVQSLENSFFIKWQEDQKWKIARHHYKYNTLFKNKIGSTFPKKWQDIPVMEKNDFQGDLLKHLSQGYTKKNCYISNTSGSSGIPLFFAKNKDAHAMDWAVIRDRYSWHGLNLNSKQARFYGIPLDFWTYYKERLKDFVMNRVRFSIYDLSDKKLEKYVQKFKNIKFQFLYGYTNSLVLFARYLIKNDIVLFKICPSLKCCITTSEVLIKEDRMILSKAFGVKVVNEYGVSEAGSITFENNIGDWIMPDETTFFEILPLKSKEDNQNGIVGNILITDLDNFAMPFIRYNIGDIGIISNSFLNNSNNKILLKLFGRENDLIRLPSGKISPGFTLYYVSREILESGVIFKEYLIRQTELDKFIFEIVKNKALTEKEKESIKAIILKYLEPGLNVTFKRVDKVQRYTSGKFKHFVSEIN